MNTSINFNEVRKLAAKAKKHRVIAECINIKDGRATWTDSIYLVVMDGYETSQEVSIDLYDYSIRTTPYPDINRIINRTFAKRDYTQEIIKDKVAYVYAKRDDDGEGYRTTIDQEALEQVKKLISTKKFNLDVSDIEIDEARHMAKLVVDPKTTIYFMLKIRGSNDNE